MSILLGIIAFIYSIKTSLEEVPLSMCAAGKPFKTMNNSCANFVEVCVKNEDKECINFKNVCSQCPPYNFSVLTYFYIQNMTDQMKRGYDKIERTLWICYLLASLIVLIIIISIIEIRFKLLTKFFSKIFGQDRNVKYKILRSRKFKSNEEPSFELTNKNKSLDIEAILNDKLDLILNKYICSTENINACLRKFQISGSSRLIEVFIRQNDNIIEIKRNICSKWPEAQQSNYKIMIIMHRGKSLDDHQYFMEIKATSDDIFSCVLDETVDPDDILILQLQCKIFLPKLLKMSKDKTISELKSEITRLNRSINDPILKQIKTGKELTGNQQLRRWGLKDEDWIDVIIKNESKVNMQSLLDETDSYYLEYSNDCLVQSWKKKIQKELDCEPNRLVLFYNGIHMKDEKYLYDYDINDENPIKFYRIETLGNSLEVKDIVSQKYEFSLLLSGQYSGTDVLIQKYSLKKNVNLIKADIFIEQLRAYLTIKSHPNFVQIIKLDLSQSFLNILLENMSEGTIVSVIGKELEETEISKWANQILCGLKHLHDNNIVHKNIIPSNILVDSSRNVKLSSFNMIEYSQSENLILELEDSPFRYWSAEMLAAENITIKSDVWSFGAVLVFLATKKVPFPNMGENDAAIYIRQYRNITYEKTNISQEFENLIELCLTPEENERPDVDSLLQHKFIKMFSLTQTQ